VADQAVAKAQVAQPPRRSEADGQWRRRWWRKTRRTRSDDDDDDNDTTKRLHPDGQEGKKADDVLPAEAPTL
jgi:hypothetical protein